MSGDRRAYTIYVEGWLTLTDPDDFDAGKVSSDEAVRDAIPNFKVRRAEVVGNARPPTTTEKGAEG